jgi:uncharacterized membrane protein YgcG
MDKINQFHRDSFVMVKSVCDKKPIAGKAILLDLRTFFVGDRVAWSQAAFLVLSGIITTELGRAGWSDWYIDYGWIPSLAVLIVSIAVLIWKRKIFYFKYHWWIISLILALIWLSVSVYAGNLADSIVGARNAFWTSLAVAVMFLIGYGFARILRRWRYNLSRALKIWLIVFLCILWAAGCVFAGLETFNLGLEDCKLADDWTFTKVRQCQMALNGIYIIVMGAGVLISFGINYYMLHCLYDPSGLDITENPPNQLYLRMMIGSMIITFIAWLLLLILFPPLAGGGGGGGKKSSSSSGSGSSSSSSSSSSSRSDSSGKQGISKKWYGSWGAYGFSVITDGMVEKEWEEHGLGRHTDRR